MTTTGFVGAEEAAPEIQGNIVLYPNPAQDQFSIRIDNFQGKPVFETSLMDGLGRIISTTQTRGTEFSIDIQNLPSGLYWIKVQGEKASWVKKLLVQKTGQ